MTTGKTVYEKEMYPGIWTADALARVTKSYVTFTIPYTQWDGSTGRLSFRRKTYRGALRDELVAALERNEQWTDYTTVWDYVVSDMFGY